MENQQFEIQNLLFDLPLDDSASSLDKLKINNETNEVLGGPITSLIEYLTKSDQSKFQKSPNQKKINKIN